MRPYGSPLRGDQSWYYRAGPSPSEEADRRRARARRANLRAIREGERDAANLDGLAEQIEAEACVMGDEPCPTCGPLGCAHDVPPFTRDADAIDAIFRHLSAGTPIPDELWENRP